MKLLLILLGGLVAAFLGVTLLAYSPLDSCLDRGGAMRDGECVGTRE